MAKAGGVKSHSTDILGLHKRYFKLENKYKLAPHPELAQQLHDTARNIAAASKFTTIVDPVKWNAHAEHWKSQISTDPFQTALNQQKS